MILSEEEKSALINKLMQRKDTLQKQPAIVNVEENTPVQVSESQSRLMFLDSLEGGSTVYNMPSALQLEGKLNVVDLRESFAEVIQRQAALRAAFIEIEGVYYQKVLPKVEFDIPVIQVVSESEAHDRIEIDMEFTFDLSRAPLLKVKLYRINDDKHILFINMHHIISDSWSLHVLLSEFKEIYITKISNVKHHLSPLKWQFIDYCAMQAKEADERERQESLKYWEKHLSGQSSLTVFPVDKLRPASQAYKGSGHYFEIDKVLSDGVDQFCLDHRITPYNFLLAIFNILIYRYSGDNDVSIISPIANRHDLNEENLIGFFVNSLVMRNILSDDISFLKLLRQVSYNSINAIKHGGVSFEYLVNKLNPERSASFLPFSQVEFVLLNTPDLDYQIPDLCVKQLKLPVKVAKYDISLSFTRALAGYDGLIEFNTDLYNASTISVLSDQYRELICSALSSPEESIAKLNFLDENSRGLLEDWACSSFQFDNNKSFVDIFQKQVSHSPSGIAVCDSSRSFTYVELDAQSNQLAHMLQKQGIAEGDRVALYLDRDVYYIVAMIACLKLGAVFVPFNPMAPIERNQAMLEYADLACVLLNDRDVEPLTDILDTAKHILLDKIAWSGVPCQDYCFSGVTNLENLAYMMYTSGSTGLPKAALVEHRGMINHLRAKVHDLKIGPQDCIAQIATQTFDVHIWQGLTGLIAGAKTVIISGEAAWEPKQLLEHLGQEKVTVVETVPSHLDVLLNRLEGEGHAYDLSHLRCMISNGEPLPFSMGERWFNLFPETMLVNAYGPTECSDDVTHYCAYKHSLSKLPYLPLGRSIANTMVYVLDANLLPVPIGVNGEIVIAGEGVGRGYFKNLEKTSANFVANTLSPTLSKYLYKTGDVGKYHADGTLEFLGRSDDQIKVRGMRIDLAEVEWVIAQHVNIARCIVSAITDKGGKYSVIAFMKVKTRPAPAESSIRSYCSKKLPDYMVPSFFIFVDEFPLMENGKIDKKKLPFPNIEEISPQREYVAPRTALEKDLVTIWKNVLQVSQVGVYDDFFQLGGHSLLAVELTHQIQERLGISIPLKTLFEAPTIDEIAQFCPQQLEGRANVSSIE